MLKQGKMEDIFIQKILQKCPTSNIRIYFRFSLLLFRRKTNNFGCEVKWTINPITSFKTTLKAVEILINQNCIENLANISSASSYFWICSNSTSLGFSISETIWIWLTLMVMAMPSTSSQCIFVISMRSSVMWRKIHITNNFG